MLLLHLERRPACRNPCGRPATTVASRRPEPVPLRAPLRWFSRGTRVAAAAAAQRFPRKLRAKLRVSRRTGRSRRAGPRRRERRNTNCATSGAGFRFLRYAPIGGKDPGACPPAGQQPTTALTDPEGLQCTSVPLDSSGQFAYAAARPARAKESGRARVNERALFRRLGCFGKRERKQLGANSAEESEGAARWASRRRTTEHGETMCGGSDARTLFWSRA